MDRTNNFSTNSYINIIPDNRSPIIKIALIANYDISMQLAIFPNPSISVNNNISIMPNT